MSWIASPLFGLGAGAGDRAAGTGMPAAVMTTLSAADLSAGLSIGFSPGQFGAGAAGFWARALASDGLPLALSAGLPLVLSAALLASLSPDLSAALSAALSVGLAG